MDRYLFGLERKTSSLGDVSVTYMEINFGLGPNASRVGPGEILKFRPV
jgi:hypothetical protein